MGKKERFFADIMAMNDGVTGSLHFVSVRFPNNYMPKLRFIVDCGLFQERTDEELNDALPFNPENLDFCLITHNHVDHIGRLPLIVKKGYRGNIYTTEPTSKLIRPALWDCHKVLKSTSKRRHTRPLYSNEDVTQTISQIKGCAYNQEFEINDNVYVTFLKNGHLVGASLIFVRITYPGYEDINLLFTGDYKGENAFFDVDAIPQKLQNLPLTIIQESTYGDMETAEMQPCFKENILMYIQNGGTVVAPVFSLGRSQEILYELKLLQKSGKLDTNIPIYFDGKLAFQYTNMYVRGELGIKPEMMDFFPENLTFVDSSTRGPILASGECKIILTTSGMGSYGPAQLYISHYIKDRNALIHFTGYTAEGTLGARLKATPYGETVEIAGIVTKKFAKVEYTTEYSAHAKADEMIAFLRQFKSIKLVLVNHGEPEVKEIFAKRIVKELNPKKVGILGRDYFFRINPYGLIKTMSTKFR